MFLILFCMNVQYGPAHLDQQTTVFAFTKQYYVSFTSIASITMLLLLNRLLVFSLYFNNTLNIAIFVNVYTVF